MKHYFYYHWFGAEGAEKDGGTKAFDALAFQKAGADLAVGMSELQALQICNLWNQGEHHRFRYWIQD